MLALSGKVAWSVCVASCQRHTQKATTLFFQCDFRGLDLCQNANGCYTNTVVSAKAYTTPLDIMAAVFDWQLATGSAHDAQAAAYCC